MPATQKNGTATWTRWVIGLSISVLIAITSVGFKYTSASYGDARAETRAVESIARDNTEKIHANREALGRIEERVKSIDKSTQRIEDILLGQAK